jgi:hypothetical protein
MLRDIQREFYLWFGESRARFTLPVSIGRRVRQRKRLRKLERLELKVVTPGYTFRSILNSDGLVVQVYLGDEFWDIIWGVDGITSKRVAGEYMYHSDASNRSFLYPSAGALWRERVFEPFLTWVNLELAKASWLAFHGTVEDATWVNLIEGEAPMEDRSLVHLVQLHRSPAHVGQATATVESNRVRSCTHHPAGDDLSEEESLA